MGDSKYMGTEECGKLCDRSPGAVRNLVMRRKIPFRKVGGRLLFIRSEIERWIETSEGLSLEDLKRKDD